MTELERLRGVGPKTAELLRSAGYETAEEVLTSDAGDLLEVEGIGEGLLRKMEITEERNLKGIRVTRDRRAKLKDAVKGTEWTLSDALRVLLPDDVEEHRMSIPEDEYVSVYVEEDVHGRVNSLAGENITALDVLDKHVGDISSEDLRERLDNELSAGKEETATETNDNDD
ncbi:hypothetical protein HCTV-16_gp101 [Haloarcula virus HCTV-16]|nr:hypothetical protein HCTV-16_gp101 [Haloarcula virus HCTV-16]